MLAGPPSAAPLSGQQYEIAAGPYRAVAVGGGGGVRTLQHEGRDLLDGYPADALSDGARGQVLTPWPNRQRAGRWLHGGREHRLPVDDAAGRHAVDGLVRWTSRDVAHRTGRRVALRHRLPARPGYPFGLDLQADYAVDARDGLAASWSPATPDRARGDSYRLRGTTPTPTRCAKPCAARLVGISPSSRTRRRGWTR